MITIENKYGTFELKFLYTHNKCDNELVYNIFQNGNCIGVFVTKYYWGEDEECEKFVEDFGRWYLEYQLNKKFVVNKTKYLNRDNIIEQIEELFNIKVQHTCSDVTLTKKICLTCVTEKYLIHFYMKKNNDIISNIIVDLCITN